MKTVFDRVQEKCAAAGITITEWSLTGVERDLPPDGAYDRPIKIF